jgi:RNA polymerase sigma-70 factor (ECF subfamily)
LLENEPFYRGKRLISEVSCVETSTKEPFEYLRYMASAAAADQKAILRDLMKAYGDDVWNYAFSLCKKADVAQDVTQEVFLKVFRKLGTFRGESSVKTWILTITRNTAADFRKAALLHRIKLAGLIGKGERFERSAESEAMENIAVTDIWQKVLKLPGKYREVLVLSAHHQLSMAEIAAILGISSGTVKSRLHHARVKVLKMKEPDGR